MYHFSSTQVLLMSQKHSRLLLRLDNKGAFQPAGQSITLIDSPVCPGDSSRHYFISADALPSLHWCCVEPIVSVSSSEQNAFVVHSSNLFYWHGTISIIVPLEETGAMAPQGKHEEEQPADAGCLLWRHHRQRIVIRCMCALQRVMFCRRHQTAACL